MATFHELTTTQLKQAVQIREQIESLQEKLDALLGGTAPAASAPAKSKRTMSAATRKKMAAAQQARYAKLKASPAPAKTSSKKSTPKIKGAITPEGRAALSAAMKARWAARKKATE